MEREENVRGKEERKTNVSIEMEETIGCNSYCRAQEQYNAQRIRVVGLAVDHHVWSPHRPRRCVSGHVDLNNDSDGTVGRVRDNQF
jgi:hypothetical protein